MTPCVASHWPSCRTSLGRRLTNEPRKLGIAQKEQRRSQPLASLSGAIGPASRRRRTARGPVAGAPAPISATSPTSGWSWCPGTEIPEASRSTGEIGSSRRRSDGVCGWWVSPPRSPAASDGDVGVVVEAEDRVGLGQRLGEVLAVPLGQAAHGDDGLRAAAVPADSLRSAASSSVSTESFLAASTKPQVLTRTVSASSASSTSTKPPASSRPASSSESTSLRAQPRVTTATFSGVGGRSVSVVIAP